MNENELINTASQLLKQEKWKDAGALFRQVWEKENNAYTASRYLHCLRKAGYPSANFAPESFPQSIYIIC
jgi:hypothetical protein